jgi:GNAT superfamily N-acetyltransferase
MSSATDPVRFVHVDLAAHRPALMELNVEFMTWIAEVSEELFDVRFREVAGLDVRAYVEETLDAMVASTQRNGAYYLIEVAGAAAGMGALRRFADGVAEVKRMYVRPAYRGRRLGAMVLAKLLDDACSLGYERVRLDTGRFMTAAHRVYEAAGFVECDPYEGVEVPKVMWPHWRFMELSLR